MSASLAPSTLLDIQSAAAIKGWMSLMELAWLARQARSHSIIVELGSYLGRSTLALAHNTVGVVYAVDDWRGLRDFENGIAPIDHDHLYERFLSNIKDCHNIRPLVFDHATPPSEPSVCDMVFIDGSHDYDSVCRDVHNWMPRLSSGGLLCGHDMDWPGVYTAVEKCLSDYREVEGCPALWWTIKP